MTCDTSRFALGPTVYSTNKTDHHDMTEILLKVALNTITHIYIFRAWQESEINWYKNILPNDYFKNEIKNVSDL